jgi:hypothetical protein
MAGNSSTVLASNDNRAPGQLDARIAYVLPRTGTYYIRVTDAKRLGGVSQSYNLLLDKDAKRPAAAIRPLAGGVWLHARLQQIRVEASDLQTEINHVKFYVRAPGATEWQYLGVDHIGSDGWRMNWDTSNLPVGKGYAIFVYAFDGANNYRGVGMYNLGIERNAPTVQAVTRALYGDGPFREFVVTWANGADPGAGIANFDIQVRKGATGAWTNWLMETTLLRARYVGAINQTYYFRARARDKTGNISAFAGGNGDANFKVTVCPVAADSYESDGAASSARAVRVDGSRYRHNFHAEDDHDWIKFTASANATYSIRTFKVGAHADTMLTLYKSDGRTILATNDDIADPGGASRIIWKAPASGTYYAQVTHNTRYGYGCTTAYDVAVTKTATAGMGATLDNQIDNTVDGEPAPPGDLEPLDEAQAAPPSDQPAQLFLPLMNR